MPFLAFKKWGKNKLKISKNKTNLAILGKPTISNISTTCGQKKRKKKENGLFVPPSVTEQLESTAGIKPGMLIE